MKDLMGTTVIQVDDSEAELLQLSYYTVEGIQGHKTMRLQGLVQDQALLILIDSSSSSTFVSSVMIAKLQLPTTAITPVHVTIADGTSMTCDTMVQQLKWWVQGHTFTSDARVLQLKGYDMILGADWLATHSPMYIHWQKKKMRFTHQGARITLRGVKDKTNTCSKLKVGKLQGLLKKGGISQLVQLSFQQKAKPQQVTPPEISELVEQYDHLFQEPKGLPPQRQWDHNITLMPGVQLVNIKPYRYNPTQKDEIERQVREMLVNGVVQPSRSPFSSPVLLVKKKDGSWRFCVDYRQLNALTVKNKYPLPVVDELLDELHGAQWFTKLAMRSGYHQIRLNPADEHKTAFKTHNGHWDFKVMPFGLTNAPATFQSIMNSIFAPLLRKSVLVFVDDILIYSKSLEDHKHHL
jgi:hypothetical protein